jgi:hypothetical protein
VRIAAKESAFIPWPLSHIHTGEHSVQNNRFASRPANILLVPQIFCVACGLSYPIMFALVYESDFGAVLCSLVHALFSSIVMYRIVSRMFIKQSSKLSMATMFILINLLYFSASSIKYFERELYPGFINNNPLRLAYSILTLVILWISFEVVIRLKSGRKNIQIVLDNRVFLLWLLFILLVINCISIYTNYQQNGPGYSYYHEGDVARLAIDRTDLSVLEKLWRWLLDFANIAIVLLIALTQNSKKNRMLLIVPVIIYFIGAVLSGNRGLLFYFVAGLIFSIPYIYGISKKTLARAIFMGPLIMVVGSILILAATGRVSINDKEGFRFQLAYRFDLCDFAATIILTNGAFRFNYEQIADAVVYSIPKVFYQNKYIANQNTALERLYAARLDERTDYTDTYFSIGAQIGGIVGFIALPIFAVLLLHFLEQIGYRILSTMAYFCVILMAPLFLKVETDLNTLFADWRMLPIYLLFGILFHYLFAKNICYVDTKSLNLKAACQPWTPPYSG